MVVRQKQRFRNQQIGVIRADMSVANSLADISNSMERISNTAFREAAVRAEEKGRKFVADLPDNQIMGIDEKGQPVNLLNDLRTSLSTKGYGTIAKRTVEREIRRRFATVAKNAYVNKAAELSAKYRFQPTKFQEEFSNFLLTQAQPYDGEYRNAILDGGTAYGAAVKSNIVKNSLINQQRISAQNWSEEAEKTYSNDYALGIANLGSDIVGFENVMKEDLAHNETKNIATNLQFNGALKINGNGYTNTRKSNYGQGVVMGFHQRLLDSDPLLANDLQRAITNKNKTLRGLDKLKEKLGEEGVKRISKALSFVENNGDILALERSVTKQKVVASNRSSLISAQETEIDESFQETVLKNNETIQNELLTPDFTDRFEKEISIANDSVEVGKILERFINDTYSKGLTKQKITVGDRTLEAKNSPLTQTQVSGVIADLRKSAETEIASRLINSTKDTAGNVNLVKANRIIRYLGDTDVRNLDGFSQPEITRLRQFEDFTSLPREVVEKMYPFGPQIQPSQYSKAIRASIGNEMASIIEDITSTKGLDQKQAATQSYFKQLDVGAVMMGNSTTPDREKVDDYIFGDIPNLPKEQRPRLYFDPSFVTSPDFADARTRIAQLVINQNAMPESLRKSMQAFVAGNNINSQQFAAYRTFIKGFVEDTTFDEKTNTVAQKNVFANHSVNTEVTFIKQLEAAIEINGEENAFSTYQKFIELQNDRERLNNAITEIFQSEEKYGRKSGRALMFEIVARKTGGRNTVPYRLLTQQNGAALDMYIYRKLSTNRGFESTKDFGKFIEETLKQSFGSGDGFILESHMINASDGEKLTRFAPMILFGGNKEYAKDFKKFSADQVSVLTDGKVNLIAGTTNGFGGDDTQVGNFFSLSPVTAESQALKGFLIPENDASIVPITSLDEEEFEIREQNKIRTSFLLYVSYNGELVPYIREISPNEKDFVRISLKDYAQFKNFEKGIVIPAEAVTQPDDKSFLSIDLNKETPAETKERKQEEQDKMESLELLQQQLMTPGVLDSKKSKLVERIMRTPMSPEAKIRELQKIRDQ